MTIANSCCSNPKPCPTCKPIEGIIAKAEMWTAPDCLKNQELVRHDPSTGNIYLWAKPDGEINNPDAKPEWVKIYDPAALKHPSGGTITLVGSTVTFTPKDGSAPSNVTIPTGGTLSMNGTDVTFTPKDGSAPTKITLPAPTKIVSTDNSVNIVPTADGFDLKVKHPDVIHSLAVDAATGDVTLAIDGTVHVFKAAQVAATDDDSIVKNADGTYTIKLTDDKGNITTETLTFAPGATPHPVYKKPDGTAYVNGDVINDKSGTMKQDPDGDGSSNVFEFTDGDGKKTRFNTFDNMPIGTKFLATGVFKTTPFKISEGDDITDAFFGGFAKLADYAVFKAKEFNRKDLTLSVADYPALAKAGQKIDIEYDASIGYYTKNDDDTVETSTNVQWLSMLRVDGVIVAANLDGFSLNMSGDNSYLADSGVYELITTGNDIKIEVSSVIYYNNGANPATELGVDTGISKVTFFPKF